MSDRQPETTVPVSSPRPLCRICLSADPKLRALIGDDHGMICDACWARVTGSDDGAGKSAGWGWD